MTDNNEMIDYFERKNSGFLKMQKFRLKNKLGWLGVPKVIPYRGFGSYASGEINIAGALYEDKGLEKPEGKNSSRENILAMLKRYSGDQIPGARIKIYFDNEQQQRVTEENGIFKLTMPLNETETQPHTKWKKYHAELLDQIGHEANNFRAEGEILIPGADASFGVISDIDDTIMISHSTRTLRKLRLMLTHNSRTRKPFLGVEAFYRALHQGVDGHSRNPFFYLSSSEWNLYDLIDDFCSYNQFPKGVYLLREIKPGLVNLWKQGGGNHEHKFDKIIKLFKMYPNLSFVLVGDNGQHDPEIYARVARIYPRRIKAIYIRTVRKKKDKYMKKLIAEMEDLNVQMVFTPDTINAAQHAQSINIIAESSVKSIIENSLTD
ncbi:phosphatase domain-containing protein [uncultured Draconibacterium sp.]|uniref:App1 family protein n=1 Tax=uncultured Draconibacterium sp. TaxID=1573823 RepID=UPI0029C93D12|nr:phosphatase domain-containing protein [uncultured Draconibacterium sp.]